ncbi:glycoside hydrolase family 32 protein [Bipolaris sorokiniana ND90Pr]|uniref:Glycoside hydrolase family 32 protein n=1 Tax=Cochliobolus sativus (strain ND90Pr / ATCC 201652) TaxID=665912 RepID=M2RAU1_COCSN|nr:glycoside hydrolase family 32 protein [Bipolaris sorokiniana ND90Pr]EMD63984.1 glycoside hydrolase family 32 protein [Bipolaris sorokiniana ND90Pr]
MNDPQRPFFVRGEYHLYYLWNSDWNTSHSTGGGTEWYHVTSYDMVHWTRQGVAIRKYQPNPSSGVILGDLWSGSCVVDTRNSTGFGQDAVIVIVTQAQDDIQQQSLFYSQDTGYTFSAYDKNPILPNPGPEAKPAFRDPKVIWDDKAGHWVTALAEGSKIGFYTSSDLKIWNYVSGFSPIDSGVDLGLLECPDLYQIDLDGNTTARVWILAASANGYLHGKTTGTVYWVGTWNGTHFTTRNSFPQWMDEGPDFYATVSWENPNDKYGSRYAIGWMNNWEYANTLPYYNDYAGQMSLVREVKYRTINGIPALVSLPIAGYDAVFSRQVSVYGTTITTDPATASLPANLTRGAYVIRAKISKARYDDGNQVHIRIKSNEGYNTTIGYDFAEARAFLARDSDGTASDALGSEPKKVWDAVRSGVNHAGGSTVQLAIYVDYNSVEVFVNEGVPTLSGLIYPNQGAEGIEIVSDVGNLTLTLLTCASFTG